MVAWLYKLQGLLFFVKNFCTLFFFDIQYSYCALSWSSFVCAIVSPCATAFLYHTLALFNLWSLLIHSERNYQHWTFHHYILYILRCDVPFDQFVWVLRFEIKLI